MEVGQTGDPLQLARLQGSFPMLQKRQSDAIATWLTRQTELWDALSDGCSRRRRIMHAYKISQGSVSSQSAKTCKDFAISGVVACLPRHSFCGNFTCSPCRGHSQGDDSETTLRRGCSLELQRLATALAGTFCACSGPTCPRMQKHLTRLHEALSFLDSSCQTCA